MRATSAGHAGHGARLRQTAVVALFAVLATRRHPGHKNATTGSYGVQAAREAAVSRQWFELRGQFDPQACHLGTESPYGVHTACGGRWSHGEDYLAVAENVLHGKPLCGACFKVYSAKGLSDE